MDDKKVLDGRLATAAWGLLFVWWGVSIFFDPIPFWAGIAGTGLILLGVNGMRALRGIPTRGATSACGILALAWGVLELVRARLQLPFILNDWAVFSILLVVFGLMLLGAALHAAQKRAGSGPASGA